MLKRSLVKSIRRALHARYALSFLAILILAACGDVSNPGLQTLQEDDLPIPEEETYTFEATLEGGRSAGGTALTRG